ncbi:archaetidylserine decarboxylase [Paenibacillus sp. JX-17]|uniref:phosphatidylserine decarboxylase n=1 Tax=Paenibacillus lacisoli TaxID=3064525 RepID=A0ABT9CCQ4_9BACL|nr:archaetidylserine decarboxylase [Paenibacillus sp. JX-17]MDO7907012.1 archaetidylserine decarboxylase [Paenibacillus sp. JX-17]
MAKQWLRLMTELSSRKWVCRVMGSFAHSGISRHFIPTFIKSYQIPAHEAEHDWKDYRSLNAFFTRRLKPGMRPVDVAPDSLISPVDARITFMDKISSGTLFNVKGQDYTLQDLLNHSPHLEKYKHGYAFVLYLSPTDYHRIHAPVTGTLIENEHIRGKVYPVNEFGLTHMRGVLSRNERLITYMAHEGGEVAVVKVGAMNVSSIKYADEQASAWERGSELAYFEFGSTVVLLTENGTFEPDPSIHLGDQVRMGQRLGRFIDRNANTAADPLL